jgi:hypothetical protein
MQMGQIARQNQQQNQLMQQRDVMIANQTRDQQMQEQRFVQQQQREAQTADLTARALQGDPKALSELATVNFDRWRSLDGSMKQKATEESAVFGNAALDLLNTPSEQRRAKLQGYVQQMGQQYPEVAQIAQLPPEQLDAALRSAVFEAQMVDKLIAMERPDYQPLGSDQVFVDIRNPSAVAQFTAGNAGAQQPAPVAEKVIGGTTYVQDGNGDWYVKGGTASNGGGSF